MLKWLVRLLLVVSQADLGLTQGEFTTPKPFDGKLGDASDLTSFVTRPEIKAPLFDVKVHNADAITPGYWFVAPYVSLVGELQYQQYYQACQVGPSVYDNSGELIYSGTCLVENKNAVDFRAFTSEGRDYASAILYSQSPKGRESSKAIILNDSLQITSTYELSKHSDMTLNMHEFNVINNGKNILHLTKRSIEQDISNIKQVSTNSRTGRIVDNGFVRVDFESKEVLFQWWAADHIPLNDSSAIVSGLTQTHPKGWNWIHLNSVDKNQDGDYLVCARYTNAIYKVSGKDGTILWTLGGRRSSFQLEPGFNFSRQHDARFIRSGPSEEVISFLDNAADDHGTTSSTSSGLLVSLDVAKMTARIVQRWPRPSGEVTRQRGNFQILPNGNVFAGWSDNSHLSEHSSSGELLMEARWKSQRFNTYRTWKANFTSVPAEPPVAKAFVYGTSSTNAILACYVSWNGATRVSEWQFYARGPDGKDQMIGQTQRTGFEMLFQVSGCHSEVHAVAISKEGDVLGRSATVTPLYSEHICLNSGGSGSWAQAIPYLHLPRTLCMVALAVGLIYAWRLVRRKRR